MDDVVTTDDEECGCQGGFWGRTNTRLVTPSPPFCSGAGMHSLSSRQLAIQHTLEMLAPTLKRAALQAWVVQQVWTQASKVLTSRTTVKLTRVVLPVPMGTEEGKTSSRKSGQEDGDEREKGG